MSVARKTITVTSQQDAWIKAQVERGDFTNDSEYIRHLIRQDQAREAEVAAIRNELILGEESGDPEPFDAEAFKAEMIAKHGARRG